MDRIKIKELEVYAHHGVFPEENILGQKFLVSVELGLYTREAGMSDDLNKSVNYAEVASFINQYLQEHTFQLIETVAEHVAEEILLRFPVEEIKVEMKKPWAPILLPMDTVAVEIVRKWHTAYLSIGSNMGDKLWNLEQAIELLRTQDKIRIMKVSNFLETEPYGGVEQDDFLNGAIELKTLFTPHELLEIIADIEKKLERERLIHWGPRTIDLDILLYDDLVIREPDLIVPHVEMHKRAFVLEPLEQIAPHAIHPLLGRTVYELWNSLSE